MAKKSRIDSKTMGLPDLPDNIGKRRKIKTLQGGSRYITVLDEIKRLQSNKTGKPNKLIVLQKLHIGDRDTIEYRFGYYVIGFKSGAKGRWVWGQYALIIPARELKTILREAVRRSWFKL